MKIVQNPASHISSNFEIQCLHRRSFSNGFSYVKYAIENVIKCFLNFDYENRPFSYLARFSCIWLVRVINQNLSEVDRISLLEVPASGQKLPEDSRTATLSFILQYWFHLKF